MDADHVLINPSNGRSRLVYHLPDPDGGTLETRCMASDHGWREMDRRERERVPDDYELCRRCDPDYQVSEPGPQSSLYRTLEAADPDVTLDGGAD